MTPFAGVGVNVGMEDALLLAREIISACQGNNSLDDALKAYEIEMFPRAKENAEKTEHAKLDLFTAGAAKRTADRIRAEMAKVATAT